MLLSALGIPGEHGFVIVTHTDQARNAKMPNKSLQYAKMQTLQRIMSKCNWL